MVNVVNYSNVKRMPSHTLRDVVSNLGSIGIALIINYGLFIHTRMLQISSTSRDVLINLDLLISKKRQIMIICGQYLQSVSFEVRLLKLLQTT